MSDAQISAYADAAYGIAAAEGNIGEVEDERFRLGRVLQTNDELRGTLTDAHLPAYRLAGFPVAGVFDLNHERAREVAAK